MRTSILIVSKKLLLSKPAVHPDDRTHGLGIKHIQIAKQERHSDEFGLGTPFIQKKRVKQCYLYHSKRPADTVDPVDRPVGRVKASFGHNRILLPVQGAVSQGIKAWSPGHTTVVLV